MPFLDRPDRKLYFGVFLISLATLMYELILTRIFSVLMWYHFASMAISLALFGMGTAALLIYLKPGWFPFAETRRIAARCSLLFGLSVSLFFAVFVLFRLQPQFGFRVLSFFHQPFYQTFQQGFYEQGMALEMLPALTALYLVTALPFFFSGLALTLILGRYLNEINRVYFWDLLGAGFGCLLIILLLHLLGGITAILAIALTGLLAALMFLPKTGRIGGFRWATIFIAIILLAAGIANMANGFAEIRFVRGRFEPNLLWSSWNSFSRVAVYPSQSQEMNQAWGLSRNYRGPIPEQLGMVVDDTGYTTMYRAGDAYDDFFRSNVIALPYSLHDRAKSLVIGPGGGKDVLVALSMGARDVTAVEMNSLIVQAVNQEFGAFTGELYRQPNVRVAIDEGRNYIRRSDERYDVIQASAVFGRTAPAAGAFTLSENNLYTVEAFRDYWNHLTDDGILTIARFIFERETLRLVSLGLALLQEKEIDDPGAHLAIIKERGLANVMLKRSPFTAAEIATLRKESAEKGFRIVYLPDDRSASSSFGKLIASGGSESFYESIPFDLRPTTDDQPFFYYMLKPADFIQLFSFPEQSSFEDRALLTLRNLLLVVTVIVAVFLLLPLLIWRRSALREPAALRRILYFSCLGLGFMLIEIGLLRRFILFLGQPIYALAVILCALLIFSGFGSLISGPLAAGRERRFLGSALLALLLLSLVYIWFLPGILDAAMTASLLQRCGLSVLLLAPLGILLGMPLPVGMKLMHPTADGIAWSWGINSATSVWGALLAVVLAMNFGFTLTLVFGTVVYLVALITVLMPTRSA
ncbi:MAG: hypothetical protein C0623_02580 [Desulfuromonas sp.]|nr:MAG: hypothetical protein C0623_02580 [Desulfuromonas sp.]